MFSAQLHDLMSAHFPSSPLAEQVEIPQGRLPESHEWMPTDYFRRATLNEIFPARPEAPVEIDLGCGDGSFLANLAKATPEHNFLGVERLLGRVRGSSRKARENGCDNVRVLRLESEYSVEWLLPENMASRIHLLFPDPWPKKKHAHNRLFRTDFLAKLRKLLVPEGEFLFKTDHEEYFAWAEELSCDLPGWQRLPWPAEAFYYPLTDFETHWLSQGKKIQGLRLRRIEG